MYSNIINPKTGKKVKITSKKGKQILKKFLNNIVKFGGNSTVNDLFPKLISKGWEKK